MRSIAPAPRRSASPKCRRYVGVPLKLSRVSPEIFDSLLQASYEQGSHKAMEMVGGLDDEFDLTQVAQELEPSDLLESDDDAPDHSLHQCRADRSHQGQCVGRAHRALRKPARCALPGRRRAARRPADAPRARAARRLAHQGHVETRYCREAPAAGRPHIAAHRRTRRRRARIDHALGPRRTRRTATARQAGRPPQSRRRSAWTTSRCSRWTS